MNTSLNSAANRQTTTPVRTSRPEHGQRTPDKLNNNNNNVYQHHAYCINCIKKDHICAECEFERSAALDQNSIYCVIEKGELHEMKILRPASETKTSSPNKTSSQNRTVSTNRTPSNNQTPSKTAASVAK